MAEKNKPTSTEHTPLMRQYITFKEKVGDALLFFRVGDFYELFFEDAARAGELLDITVTSRGQSAGQPLKMAGVPWHAVDAHLAKLSKMGVAAAVVDQIGDPATSKGPVERALSRVITPGTLVDEPLLDEKSDPTLLAVFPFGSSVGLALLTVCSGSAIHHEVPIGELAEEIDRLRPSEILCPDGFSVERQGLAPTSLPAWRFDPARGADEILAHFEASALEAFGLDASCKARLGALAAAWTHAKNSFGGRRPPIEELRARSGDAMRVDSDTARALEIFETSRGGTDGALFSVLDRCSCPMGSRALRRWLGEPSTSAEVATERHDAIEALSETSAEALRTRLKGFPDIERASVRLSARSSRCRDFSNLRIALRGLDDILSDLSSSSESPLLGRFKNELARGAPALLALLESSVSDEPPVFLRDGGFIRAGRDPLLDELRDLSEGADAAMAQIETNERALSGISTLRVDFNRAHGFSIEVSKAAAVNAPERWTRRQTLKNAERFVTPELMELEEKVLGARERLSKREKELFEDLQNEAAIHASAVLLLSRSVAALDALASHKLLAAERGYSRPRFSELGLRTRGLRHPCSELSCEGQFIPNDVSMGGPDAAKTIVITGPNMGGKSTLMRSVALACLSAQAGLFVAADEALLPVMDSIRARAGASDDTSKSRSTFMTEMAEAAAMLRQSGPRSLCVVDEIGRGTSTHDGMSLAWACLRHLREANDAWTLFSTHYFEIAEMAQDLDGAALFRMDAKAENGQAVFLRKLVPGMARASMGLEVARMAGLPEKALAWARAAHAELEFRHLRTTVPTSATGEGIPAKISNLPPERLAPDPLRAALEGIDPDTLTPKQALEALYALKTCA